VPTYKFSVERPSPLIPGGWLYCVYCERCKANLGAALEGFGPLVVEGLSADEAASRLLRQNPPAKDTANVLRHHEARCSVGRSAGLEIAS